MTCHLWQGADRRHVTREDLSLYGHVLRADLPSLAMRPPRRGQRRVAARGGSDAPLLTHYRPNTSYARVGTLSQPCRVVAWPCCCVRVWAARGVASVTGERRTALHDTWTHVSVMSQQG